MADDRLGSDQSSALRCIEELLETNITENQLLQAADLLTASQYNDVVDERNIEHFCGYPLCNKELVNVPKQKYHISTATNQVLDITQRKKFCSSRCFKSSNYFSSQLSTLPPKARTSKRSVQLLSSQDSSLCKPVTEKVASTPCIATLSEPVQTLSKEQTSVQQELEHPTHLSSTFTDQTHTVSSDAEFSSLQGTQGHISTDHTSTNLSLDTHITTTSCADTPLSSLDQSNQGTKASLTSLETKTEHSSESMQRISDSLTIWLGSDAEVNSNPTGNIDPTRDVLNPPLHDMCVGQVQRSLFLSKVQSTVRALGEEFETGVVEWASSFRLTSKCVTFRPPQWRVIVLLLIAIQHGEQCVNCEVLESLLKELNATRQEFDSLLTKGKQLKDM